LNPALCLELAFDHKQRTVRSDRDKIGKGSEIPDASEPNTHSREINILATSFDLR
jgi:hypothetical protein